jgi:hypothetical protein
MGCPEIFRPKKKYQG